MRYLTLGALLLPILANATDGHFAKAQAVVRDRMKDPSSVQFKEVHFVPKYKVVCGRYNAKNSFGAYTGFRLFAVNDGGEFFEPFLPPKKSKIELMNEQELREGKAALERGKITNQKLEEWCAPMGP